MRTNHLLFAGVSVLGLLVGWVAGRAEPAARDTGRRFTVPAGFVVDKVAEPPLIRYPLFACLDDAGRLFVAEGTGTNLPGPELLKLKKQLGKITMLEDTNGDGTFDKATTFADDLTFPTGVLCHDGAVYCTSHPYLWRFQDTDGDGKADRREAFIGKFNFNGNGCDIHGPFLGPEGRLYWTEGRHGYKIKTREGNMLEGFAARVFRCRTDGSAIERLAGGGFDNPVELAFTAGGELLGTMDQGPGDAILHYVEGGVYPMDHPCIKEFQRTGPMLPPVRQFGAALPVALCGTCRIRSPWLGADYQDTLLTSQFNVHRIQRHTLVRDGATFRTVDKDLLTSSDYDTHFTDVLEDADGSLLVVDMGAWFTYGCPNALLAKPEVLGGIYRIRRADAPRVADPWGKQLKMEAMQPRELVSLLDDPRHKVRDRAIERLGKLGAAAVPALAEAARPRPSRGAETSLPGSVESRRCALWALCRIPTAAARAAMRGLLSDGAAEVRLAAAHAVGVEKDAEASAALMKLACDDGFPAVRLKAAEALGRIGKPAAIPALFDSIKKGCDRFLEHALIFALIRINDPPATLPALADPNPRVRQAGLIALDQMKDGNLTRAQVVPLLDTDDQDLQQAVLEIMGRRPGWSGEVVGLLKTWLESNALSPAQESSLTGALLAFSTEANVQQLVADALAGARTPVATRLLLLRVLARTRVEPLPRTWLAGLEASLAHDDSAVIREAVSALKARNLSGLDARLEALSRRPALPVELRIAALDCFIPRRRQLAPEAFTLLLAHVPEKTEPLLRVAAARTLGSASLNAAQFGLVIAVLAEAGPMIVPLVAPAFARTADPAIGLALVAALKQAPGTDALSADELDKLLQHYPDEVRQAAQPIRARLAARQQEQAAYLAKLTLELLQVQGNSERGKEVFFSKKAACYGCHRAAGKGGQVGPDLSLVGRFRTNRDLLESIVFPSAAIIPEFRAYVVSTTDGRVATGMILRETSDAIYLRTAQLAEVRIARKIIDDMSLSKLSIMPEGLEKTMSRQELSDLLEFLYSQR